MRLTYRHYRCLTFPVSDKVNDEMLCEIFGFGDVFVGRHGPAARYFKGVSCWTPAGKGGYTVCTDEDSGAFGVAECSPRDGFCYRIGAEIARGRALKALKVVT